MSWRLTGAELCPALKDALAAYQAETDANRKARLLRNLTEVERFSRCYIEFLHAAFGFKDFVRRIEALRTDKQLGGGPSSGGGTNLVSRGAVARTLSLAAEYGALAESVSGQVVTFRGNLAGLPAALLRKDVFPYCDPRTPESRQTSFCVSSSLLGQLRKFSFGVSFDPGRSAQPQGAAPLKGAEPAAYFTASRGEVSAVSLRYEIWNRRDVSSPAYQQKWEQKLSAQRQIPELAGRLSAAFEPVFEKLGASPAYAAWQAETQERVRTSSHPEQVLGSQISRLASLLLRENILTADDLGELRRLYSRYGFEQDELMELAAGEPVIAIEYAYHRLPMQLPESALRFLFDVPLSRGWSLAVNTACTFRHGTAEAAGSEAPRLRDVQLGAQAERLLGNLPSLGPATFSAAVRLQYQNSPAVLRTPGAGAVLSETGSIAAGQLKLTFGSRGGVRFPLSVTYANRTSLVPKPAWQAQLGITYDFDLSFLP